MKRILALMCALLYVLSALPAYAEGTVPASPTGSVESIPVATQEPELADLANGSRGDEVLRLQKRLAVLGFFYTAEDGIYGANTQNAVLEFENYVRLLEQDEIDRLIEANKTPEPTASPVPTATQEATQTPGPDADAASVPAETAELAGTATAVPELTATPEPTPEPTPVPTPETPADGMADVALQELLYGDVNALYRRDAQSGDKGADVLRIQRRLVYLNYLNDAPDSAFGDNTENAVKAFQREHDLNETGVADKATQELLFSEDAARSEKPVYNKLYLGVIGEDVKNVQKQLRLLGFTNSKVSGTYDANTQAAVMLLESYLNEIDLAAAGVQIATVSGTPVPDEILDSQGEIEGDPETNPYEIMPGEEAKAEETAEPSGQPSASAAPIEEADSTQTATDEPTPQITPEPTKFVSVPVNPVSSTAEPEAFAPTGVMTAELQERLLDEGIPVYLRTVQRGSTGEQVRRVQRRLYSLGYLTANGVDGILGKGSEAAISAFQRRNKLAETGSADQATQAALFSEDAVKAIKPYQIKISLDKQKVYVYTHDDKDEYNVLVKEFICSTGLNETPTPKGTFTNTGPGARWHYFKKFECWAQYAYYIDGDIMFHSVLYDEQDEDTLRKGSVHALGSKASHGCVRLQVEDAEWIYYNCKAGTTVVVY